MRHPDPKLLQEYIVGKLDPPEADEIERHLTQCASCEETVNVAEISRHADAFVEILTAPNEPEPYDDEPELRKMLERIERIVQIGQEATFDSIEGRDDERTGGEPAPPVRLGEYELGAAIGSGGMGAVFRGFHRRLRRPVAIKLLKSDRSQDAAAVDRFEREMEAVGRLEHAHIVRALDAGESEGTLFLVMDLADGLSLSDVAARIERLDVANACEAVRQAALGIAAAHRAGMTHRDVKPGNLMLARQSADDGSPRAVVKVLDLGLARFHEATDDGAGELTGDGQVMGTIDYMAPEQAISSRQAGPPADVYSLGATLYRLLTGRTPLDVDAKAGIVQRLSALTSRPAPPVRSLRPELPADLAKLIDRTLDRSPQARPSAGNLVSLLEPFAKGADLASLLALAESDVSTTDRALVPTVMSRSEAVDTTSDLSFLDKPKLAPAAAQPPRNRVKFWSLAAVGAMLPILLLGVIFFLQTPKGTIRVEIDDPGIEVRIKDGKTLLSGPGEEETTISVGEHGLVVSRGDLTFETDKFVLKKGGTVSVRVELVEGTLRATADGKEIGRIDAPKEAIAVAGTPAEQTATVEVAPPDREPVAKEKLIARDDKPVPQSSADGPATMAGPSPFDALRHEDLTNEQLRVAGGGDPDAAPLELVKVYGDGRFPMTGLVTAWSPDGSLYVDYGARQSILTDATTGVPIRKLAGLDWIAIDACFSRDGKTVWTGVESKTSLCAHDVATGRLLWRRANEKGHVVTIVERPDGVSIVSGNWSGVADVWNGRTGERIGGFDAQIASSVVAAFDSTGRTAALIVRGDSPALELRDVDSGKLLLTIPGSFAPISAAFDSAGANVATAALDAAGAISEIVVMDTVDGTERHRIPISSAFAPKMRFAPDGALVVASDGIRRVDVQTGKVDHAEGTGGPPFAFSADGRRILAVAPWGGAMIYDWKTLIRSEDATLSVDRLGLASVSRDDDEIAIVSGLQRTEIRDVASDAVDRVVPNWVGFATIDADGNFMGAPNKETLIAMSRGRSVVTRRVFSNRLGADATRAVTSPDGSLLAVPAAKSVLIVEASTGETTATVELPNEANRFAISVDNRHLAVTSWVDREVAVWRIADATLVRTLIAPEQINLLGNVEFSPAGDQLAVASFDGPILWTSDDWETGEPAVREFRCEEGYIDRISFRPDGTRIAAAVDVGFRIWDPRDVASDSIALVRHSTVMNKAVDLTYAPDGRHIVAKVPDGRVVVVRTDPRPFRPVLPESVGLAFDGKSTNVRTPATWDGTSPITFEAWLNPEATKSAGVFGSPNSCLELLPWRTSFIVRDSAGALHFAVGSPLTSGKSVHVAAVYENGEMRLYVAGRYAARQPIPPPSPSGPPLRIGCNLEGTAFFKGVMDEVRISSVARYKDDDFTPQRRFETDADTVALYHMDEGEGDVLNDASGNGRHGEVSNGTWVRSSQAASENRVASESERNLAVRLGTNDGGHKPFVRLPIEADRPFTLEANLRPLPNPEGADLENVLSLYDVFGMRIVSKPGGHVWQVAAWDNEGPGVFCHSDAPLTEGELTHVAACWDGQKLQLFVNGVKQKQVERLDRFPTSAPQRVGSAIGFGIHSRAVEIDEIRVSQTSRYRTNFEPNMPLPADEETIALYRMNEVEGVELIDSSGKGRHGTLRNAVRVRPDLPATE